MRVSILPRVRWRILEWLLPFLFTTLLVINVQPISGAPQTHSRFSSPQSQQNPSFRQTGPFRIIPDEDDFEDAAFSASGHRNFINGASPSVGVPLSATRSRAQQETRNAANAHFGVPLASTTSGARTKSQQIQPFTSGVPLSATRSGSTQNLPQAAVSHFGVPLSATRPEIRKEARKETSVSRPSTIHRASQAERSHFGVPLSSTRSRSQQQNRHNFGISQAQAGQTFSIKRDSVEDEIDDVSLETRSHFSLPRQRNFNRNENLLFDIDDTDDISIEILDKSSEVLSLGRRFHPEGIPRLSDATLTNVPYSAREPVITNPYIFTPDIASIDRDSIEDDDDDAFVVLSPMVKAYNPSEHNERLSLSNNFLNQYNFVDVQGATHWGYETDSQYQEHKIHDGGAMEGKFGWTSPEGSQVNIKYIADEGGYRVLSSSGIYTKEDKDVLRLKEQHLAEHEKAKIHHQNVKAERKDGKTGVPLPTVYRGTQGSSISGSGGFVVVPDDDDFPLIPSKVPTGVPLPTLSGEKIMPEPEVGIFIDTSAVGVPLPTTPQDQGGKFGVPLPEQAVTRDHSSPTAPHSFGIPLPDLSSTVTQGIGVSLSETPKDPIVGVPLPDPTLSGTQDIGVPLPEPTLSEGSKGVGVPLPDPTLTASPQPESTFSGSQGVGVPLPDPTFIGRPQPESTFPGFQGVGVPLPDPTLTGSPQSESTISGSQGVGVPLPDPTFIGRPQPESTFSGSQGVGVPLPDSTFIGRPQPESTFSGSQGVGVPLPDPIFTGRPQPESTFSGSQGVGVPLPDPTFVGRPQPESTFSGSQGVGVPLPDPTFVGRPQPESTLSGSQGVGVPLPGPTIEGSRQQESTLFGSHGVGVPLPDPTFVGSPQPESTFSGSQNVGVPLPDPTLSGAAVKGVSLPRPATSEGAHSNVGVPLPSPTLSGTRDSFQDSSFKGASKDHTVGVPLPDPTFSKNSDHSAGVPISDPSLSGTQNVGVPLSDSTFFDNQNAVPLSDSALSGFQDVGVPLPDPFLSGSQDVRIPFTDLAFSGAPGRTDVGVPLSDTAHRSPHEGSIHETSLPVQTLSENQDFGVPLFGPILPSQRGTGLQSDSATSGNEAFGVPLSAVSGHQATGVSLPERASVGGPDVDLLQGPPVEELHPSFMEDKSAGLDPCLNSKLHPTLLPAHCANANVEPNQSLGKSLVPSSSKSEQPQDSFIVVVNSDIFH